MAKAIPSFTYSGRHEAYADNKYWYIKMYGTGNLIFKRSKKKVQVFIVGGGGAGGYSGGGGGGYCTTFTTHVNAGVANRVVIGKGGVFGSGYQANGMPTSALGRSIEGGNAAEINGGDGGSGGGGSTYGSGYSGGSGGTNGGNGGDAEIVPGYSTSLGGKGQGIGKTREFWEPDGKLYSGGGGAGSSSGKTKPGGAGGGGNGGYRYGGNGTEYLGGGGGGAWAQDYGDVHPGKGGSGIAIIRGEEEDFIPVRYFGQMLKGLTFGGKEVKGLIVDGIRVYARRWCGCSE